jgi:hypothetical protein
LLILRAKRLEGLNVSISFSVGYFSAETDADYYEKVLRRALVCIDNCLVKQDSDGKKLSAWALAYRLHAIRIEMPDSLQEYRYLQPAEGYPPLYWPDAEDYSHLWRLQDRNFEEE